MENDLREAVDAMKKMAASAVDTTPRILGVKIDAWMIVAAVVFGLIGFYIRTNDAMERLTVSTDWLMGYAKNSDVYHSATNGTPFEQGKPYNFLVPKNIKSE